MHSRGKPKNNMPAMLEACPRVTSASGHLLLAGLVSLALWALILGLVARLLP